MASEPWLRLLAAAETGRRPWLELLRAHGSATAVAALPRGQLAAAGVGERAIDDLLGTGTERVDRWRGWLDDPRRTLVGLDDPCYPGLLRTLPDPPLALWIEGAEPGLLSAAQIAIVGSRNPTRGGRDTAEHFARYLSERGLTITSGLASGIDAAAHAGALAGGASTIAVLGSGLDEIYPAANSALARRIAEEGLLVSEFPPGTAPLPRHFPQRNRIIAGLSVGTLVVEAARRSGSLITARLAADYGREVFAIPGSIHNPLAKGCHRLIRDGAKLVDDVSDMLVELAPLLGLDAASSNDAAATEPVASSLTEEPGYAALLETMGFEPVDIAALASSTALTTAELSSMLLVLEFEGLVEALPGGRYARLSQRDR